MSTEATRSSFFSKERITAPPGFNRWMIPPAALAVHLCIGQAYAFSVFNGTIMGQVFAMLVLTVAAAAAAVGLAILVVYFRNRGEIAVEDVNVLRG